MAYIECINADCLEYMKTLPDKSIDLFVCDLPYGCIKSKDAKKTRWDNKIDLEQFWPQIKRLCKNDNTPVLMFCNTRFGIELINSNKDWFRYDLVWNKNYGTNFLDAGKKPMVCHEMIYVFGKKRPYYKRIDVLVEGKEAYLIEAHGVNEDIYGKKGVHASQQSDGKRCVLSVITPFGNLCGRKISKRHPTAKPILLLKWLIERYSNEGDTVLDPTAGSFNSGRACLELNRNYIGIELDEDFYNKNKFN